MTLTEIPAIDAPIASVLRGGVEVFLMVSGIVVGLEDVLVATPVRDA